MDRNKPIEQYKTAGAWMRICKHVLNETHTACSSVLKASDSDKFFTLSKKLAVICSRAEDNMLRDHPKLDNEALDIFYGSPDTDPRTDTDREQIRIMQELVMKIFGENWTAGKGGDES